MVSPVSERAWELTVVAGGRAHHVINAEVQSSWARSTAAGVSPSLPVAPLELGDEALATIRRQTDWVDLAEAVLAPQLSLVRDSGHVLTLFDVQGRMISSRGDPAVLAGLQAIHFMPGANWSEAVVGTNGPGTALASGRPVHIVGAEHFCAAWHAWHCAAAPIRGADGTVVGVLDVSGAQSAAQPWSLQLAQLLVGCVESSLSARAARWRGLLMSRFGELASRYPSDLVAVVDELGTLVCANAAARARGMPAQLRLRRGQIERAHDVPQWLMQAQVHEVNDGEARVGACMVAPQVQSRSTRRAAVKVSGTRYTFDDLIGSGAGFRGALELARAASATDMPVLVLGESGVGKELLAQSIHDASSRRGGPFVAVNCAALSRELVESELFGYEGGAFSGARTDGHVGRFEAAEGGTLFLDEVGELPLPAQAALLRVLQEHEVTPVGANVPRRVDVRVLAATNRPLEEGVAQGTFRLDLFHRLSVVPVTLPALREHAEDVSVLVAHLARRIEIETGLRLVLDASVMPALRAHSWPGNVRELDNVLRRLAIVTTGRVATAEDLPLTVRGQTGPARDDVDAQVLRLMAVIDSAPNMSEAATRLGITRSTLYRQLERHGLKPRRTLART